MVGMLRSLLFMIALLIFPCICSADPPGLDKKQIEESVNAVAETIQAEYFDAEVAERVSSCLRQWNMQGRYADVKSLEELATKLTADLFELTHDRHLAVTVSKSNQSQQANDGAARLAAGKRINFGVQRAEVLPGNVGYLNITAFFRLEEAREALAAGMQVVRHADALILDLRDNGGGNPESVALLASYFFAEKDLPLFEIVPRSGEAQLYKTASEETLERNETRPIYVLISSRTFSGGEGMAFILQEHGRATIIGEKTPGAANPGRPYPVGNTIEVTVPNGQVRTSIKKSNWEGVGVTPDIAVLAKDAAREAHRLALRKLVEQAEPGEWRERLEKHLRTLMDDLP